MANRISITPRDRLRLIPKRWQGKFAEMSAEIIIQEGRHADVLQKVSGLSLSDLSGESLQVANVNEKNSMNRKKGSKSGKIENVTPQIPPETTSTVNAESQEQQVQDQFLESFDTIEVDNAAIDPQGSRF